MTDVGVTMTSAAVDIYSSYNKKNPRTAFNNFRLTVEWHKKCHWVSWRATSILAVSNPKRNPTSSLQASLQYPIPPIVICSCLDNHSKHFGRHNCSISLLLHGAKAGCRRACLVRTAARSIITLNVLLVIWQAVYEGVFIICFFTSLYFINDMSIADTYCTQA